MSLASLGASAQQALGSFNLPGAFGSSLQPDGGKTTTAVNVAVVVNGVVQGLIRSMRFEESFDQHLVKVVGMAVGAAIVPGVYTATASFSKVFLFGQDINAAFNGKIRPVEGKVQASLDFTKLYFDIVLLDNQGAPLQIFHDCALNSVGTAVEIDGVIIMEECSAMIRWSTK